VDALDQSCGDVSTEEASRVDFVPETTTDSTFMPVSIGTDQSISQAEVPLPDVTGTLFVTFDLAIPIYFSLR
jgi:hypothetical protein